MADDDQERTEQATSRRRDLARQEGNFAVSRELSTFFVIFGGLMVLYYSGIWIAAGSAEIMKKSLVVFKDELTVRTVSDLFMTLSLKFFTIIAPVLAIPIFGAVSYLIQTGFAFTGKPLSPDFSKVNPVSGFKRLFSFNSVAELLKAVIKIAVLSYVIYVYVSKEWMKLPFLMDMEPAASMSYMAKVSFTIMIRTVWVLALVAAIDYAFQRWNFEKGIRMTKEEIKEEMKEMEGDPQIKARIKSIQRELSRKRMMADVPAADVVVANPTHIAVALKYDREKASAPLVVAKGAGHLAEKIKEIARQNRVPVIENKPLARAIYKAVEIGMEIPADMYKAVAEILAYVYRLKGRVRT